MSTSSEPLARARAHLGELVDRARHGGQPTVLTDHGRPAAVVVSHDMYQDYRRLQAAEDERAIKAAIDQAEANPGSGRVFGSAEEMLAAAEAAESAWTAPAA